MYKPDASTIKISRRHQGIGGQVQGLTPPLVRRRHPKEAARPLVFPKAVRAAVRQAMRECFSAVATSIEELGIEVFCLHRPHQALRGFWAADSADIAALADPAPEC